MSPEKIIEMLDVGPQMAVADFGCGSGHYVIEAAKKTGKNGKVYAIDIQKEALGHIRSQAQLSGLTNIETIWTDLEIPQGTRLQSDIIDLVIISNILFQAEDKSLILKEAYRVIKPGGRIAVIEWGIDGENKFGPPTASRISPQAAKTLLQNAGFVFQKEFNPGDHHYGLVFGKNKS